MFDVYFGSQLMVEYYEKNQNSSTEAIRPTSAI
jgi:hypothetical protein